MSEVDDLYPLWLREARQHARADLRRADATLAGLKNVGSTYWLAVQAMRDAKKRVLDVYLAMPEALPPKYIDWVGRLRTALQQIADMDPKGERADDLGRAARVALDALATDGVEGKTK